ncbi:MAG: Gfo/Idh/MocA family oxidoreductase [Actinomycetota bacterium]|jgi:predicted dehydrogenase|nr:Gfo/Idh/MocA family oxidoreductase [Actinomycetota bacterium]
MKAQRTLRVAIVGAGAAGQAHAFGYRNASMARDLAGTKVELVTVVDENVSLAEQVAARYSAAKVSGDYHAAIEDPAIDIVSVALPNQLHRAILPEVLSSGKHVLAEKPLGRSGAEAEEIARAASRSDAVVVIGFSFRRLPAFAALAQLVGEGHLGELFTVEGWYFADYGADPSAPISWRYSKEAAGAGALIDIGSHLIDAVSYVGGPISVIHSCLLKTVIEERPAGGGQVGHVDNDDIVLLTAGLGAGVTAQLRASRVATGTPNSLGVEVRGSKGFARVDSITNNELVVFSDDTGVASWLNGPRHVVMGPRHPYFSDVAPMPGAGVGTGYGEAFVAEVQTFLRAVIQGAPIDTGLPEACRVMHVVDAALQSAASRAPSTVWGAGAEGAS